MCKRSLRLALGDLNTEAKALAGNFCLVGEDKQLRTGCSLPSELNISHHCYECIHFQTPCMIVHWWGTNNGMTVSYCKVAGNACTKIIPSRKA